MALSSLGQRVATAGILVPLVLAALWLLPPRGWGLATLVVVAAGANEWARLVGFDNRLRATLVGGVIAFGLALLFADAMGFARGWPERVVLAACGAATLFWIAVAPAWLARGWPTPPRVWMMLVAWVVLIGTWVALVELQARSPWLVLAAMAVVWLADTAAYFTGRRFGKRKLAPSISPNKTWEGAWGGLASVALYALLLSAFADEAGYAGPRGLLAVVAFVGFLMLLAMISIVGDLYESMLKRHAGVKDSGSLLPGHGGILDRVDTLLAAMPPAALAATLFLSKQ
jgi:phosphatidate cytidylyltransferase